MNLGVGVLLLMCVGLTVEGKVFLASHPSGRYKLTYKMAHNLCDSMGAHLATYKDLYHQWKNEGYEVCSCGWLLDKTARYPMNSVHKSCGSKVAIHRCSGSKFNAYCYQAETHTNCTQPLGMEMGDIHNAHIASSSYYRTWWGGYWYGYKARLHRGGTVNAWIPHDDTQRQYLEINLSTPKAVTGIVTQGAKRYGRSQYVKKFKVEYSKNRVNWKTFQDRDGVDVIFNGNWDAHTPVRNVFWDSILTQYIRIVPQDWHKHIVLRVELLGCNMTMFDRLDEIARDRMVTTTSTTTTTTTTAPVTTKPVTTTSPVTTTTAPVTSTTEPTPGIFTTKPITKVTTGPNELSTQDIDEETTPLIELEPLMPMRPGNKVDVIDGTLFVEMAPPDADKGFN